MILLLLLVAMGLSGYIGVKFTMWLIDRDIAKRSR